MAGFAVNEVRRVEPHDVILTIPGLEACRLTGINIGWGYAIAAGLLCLNLSVVM